jgi:hypothetical protein
MKRFFLGVICALLVVAPVSAGVVNPVSAGSPFTSGECLHANAANTATASFPACNVVETGLTASGTTQGTALVLSSSDSIHTVTTVASGTGVLLPSRAIDGVDTITNSGANTLAVYPPTGAQIFAPSGLGVNQPYSLPAGQSMVFHYDSLSSIYAQIGPSGGGGATTCGGLSDSGSACRANTGTSGATVPLWNATGTASALWNFNDGLSVGGAVSAAQIVNINSTITNPSSLTALYGINFAPDFYGALGTSSIYGVYNNWQIDSTATGTVQFAYGYFGTDLTNNSSSIAPVRVAQIELAAMTDNNGATSTQCPLAGTGGTTCYNHQISLQGASANTSTGLIYNEDINAVMPSGTATGSGAVVNIAVNIPPQNGSGGVHATNWGIFMGCGCGSTWFGGFDVGEPGNAGSGAGSPFWTFPSWGNKGLLFTGPNTTTVTDTTTNGTISHESWMFFPDMILNCAISCVVNNVDQMYLAAPACGTNCTVGSGGLWSLYAAGAIYAGANSEVQANLLVTGALTVNGGISGSIGGNNGSQSSPIFTGSVTNTGIYFGGSGANINFSFAGSEGTSFGVAAVQYISNTAGSPYSATYLNSDSGSATVGQIGTLSFAAYDSNPSQVTFAQIVGASTDITTGSDAGELIFKCWACTAAGSQSDNTVLTLTGGFATFATNVTVEISGSTSGIDEFVAPSTGSYNWTFPASSGTLPYFSTVTGNTNNDAVCMKNTTVGIGDCGVALGTIASENSNNVTITGGTITGVTVSTLTNVEYGLTATGSTQGTALALVSTDNTHVFTIVASATGGILPSNTVGRVDTVTNSGANNLYIYPASGSQIDTLGANNPLQIQPGATIRFNYVTSTAIKSDALSSIAAGSNVTLASANGITTIALASSPALSGTPTAPTATGGTNTTQIATTAFVTGGLGSYCALAGCLMTGRVNETTLGSASAVQFGLNSAKTGIYSDGQDSTIALAVNGSIVLDYGDSHGGSLTLGGSVVYVPSIKLSNSVVLSASGGNTVYLNGGASSTPTAQTLTENFATGSNVNGANLTLACGPSTGTGTGCNLLFQTGPTGSSGSSINALVTTLQLTSAQIAIFSGGGVEIGAPTGAAEGSGTLNIATGLYIQGTLENFPASGNILGTTDTQTVTNKSIAASEVNSGQLALAQLPQDTVSNRPLTGQSSAGPIYQSGWSVLSGSVVATLVVATAAYFNVMGETATAAATQNQAAQVLNQSGHIGALDGGTFMCVVGSAPGTGNNDICAVQVGSSTTAITCTISNTNTSCQDTTDSVAYTAGQQVNYIVTPSATATLPGRVYASMMYSQP